MLNPSMRESSAPDDLAPMLPMITPIMAVVDDSEGEKMVLGKWFEE